MPKWLLVRHGETAWNTERRVQGHSDVPMNATGIRQVKRLARRLAHTPFAAAYASDMLRTRQTAQLIAGGRDIPMHELFDLRERNYGQWEGRTEPELEAADPEAFALWKRAPDEYRPPDGESLEEVLVRASRVSALLQKAHAGNDNILIAGHGAALIVLAVHVLNMPLAFRNAFSLSNVSLSILDLRSDRAVVRLWNDTSHLGGLDRLDPEARHSPSPR